MIKQPGSSLSFVRLILWISIFSLGILVVFNGAGLLVSEASVNDLDGYHFADQSESEDDFLIAPGISEATFYLFVIKSGVMGPNYHAVDLSPVFPPPKYS
jgi:hypothetical protein